MMNLAHGRQCGTAALKVRHSSLTLGRLFLRQSLRLALVGLVGLALALVGLTLALVGLALALVGLALALLLLAQALVGLAMAVVGLATTQVGLALVARPKLDPVMVGVEVGSSMIGSMKTANDNRAEVDVGRTGGFSLSLERLDQKQRLPVCL